VDAETFERIVAAGAKQAGREVRVFERRGPAADHLLPPAFSEGQYLKVLLCYVA
jgi:23S rRNA (cytosine1962-C5)-methyltransferase